MIKFCRFAVDHSDVRQIPIRTLAGIELVRMLKKGQMIDPKASSFKSFCSLAA